MDHHSAQLHCTGSTWNYGMLPGPPTQLSAIHLKSNQINQLPCRISVTGWSLLFMKCVSFAFTGYFQHGHQQKYLMRFGLNFSQIVTPLFARENANWGILMFVKFWKGHDTLKHTEHSVFLIGCLQPCCQRSQLYLFLFLFYAAQ